MFELLDAWREVLHVSAWTGLSLGALAGLAALAWFGWQIAAVRSFVIVAAIAVVAAYLSALHAARVIHQADEAEWADRVTAAALAAKKQDADTEMRIRHEYLPQIAELQRAADDRQQKVDEYEKTLAKAKVPKGGAGPARIGPDALRLRLVPAKK